MMQDLCTLHVMSVSPAGRACMSLAEAGRLSCQFQAFLARPHHPASAVGFQPLSYEHAGRRSVPITHCRRLHSPGCPAMQRTFVFVLKQTRTRLDVPRSSPWRPSTHAQMPAHAASTAAYDPMYALAPPPPLFWSYLDWTPLPVLLAGSTSSCLWR